jgi:hypothetical protein
MPTGDNSIYETILNMGSYSSSTFFKSGVIGKLKKICLTTNRLNPRRVRAKLNAFIAVGLPSSNQVEAFSGSIINFQIKKRNF